MAHVVDGAGGIAQWIAVNGGGVLVWIGNTGDQAVLIVEVVSNRAVELLGLGQDITKGIEYPIDF